MLNIEQIRRDFPILNQKIHNNPLVYLDNAATTQKPKYVLDKVIEFYTQSNSNIHRGVHYLSELASEAYEQARIKVKNFINANSSREIIFTKGTTESINLVAACFGETRVKENDEILITEMEHHSNIVPWQILCEQKNAHLKILPFDNNGELKINKIQEYITARTKIIAVTFVSNVLGSVNPLKKIINIAHKNNIPVLVDAAQAIQHFKTDVQELDCDFFVFSGHKIYAENGIGVLYGKENLLEKMPPYQYGGGMINSVTFHKTTYADLPFKFEAGTTNYTAAISLKAAIEYLENIGLEKISAYETAVLSYACQQLETIKNIRIFGQPATRCGCVSFCLENIHAFDAGKILDTLGIAVRTGNHCAEPIMQHFNIPGTIRTSFALYNTKQEVDLLINGLKKVQEILS